MRECSSSSRDEMSGSRGEEEAERLRRGGGGGPVGWLRGAGEPEREPEEKESWRPRDELFGHAMLSMIEMASFAVGRGVDEMKECREDVRCSEWKADAPSGVGGFRRQRRSFSVMCGSADRSLSSGGGGSCSSGYLGLGG